MIVVGHAPVIAYAALDVASRISPETTEQVGERGCPTGTAFIFRAEGELGAERYEWVDTVITPARGSRAKTARLTMPHGAADGPNRRA